MPTGAFFNLRSFSEGGGEGWGNVRLSFTSKDETVNETATYETANQNTERTQFVRYATAKLVYSSLFNNSNPGSTLGGGGGGGPGPPPDPDQPVSGFAQRLNGSTNERYGIAKSISVMPGDVINAQVYVKYVDPVSSNWNSALTTLMGQIAASTAGVVVDGSSYTTSTSSFPYAGLLTTTTTGAPRAYLNWLVFDRNFGFITGGFRQMGSGAKETGTDVAHEMLTLPAAITITQPGYVYIYLSNESPTLVDVFFDDFKVTHTKSPVIQAEEYYPFGGEFNSYQRENSVKNRYRFAGKELIEDMGLDPIDFGQRHYDRWVLRFTTQDRFAEKYYWMTPYQYAANNPIYYVDINGDSLWINHKGNNYLYDGGKLYLNGSEYTGKVKGFLKQTVNALGTLGKSSEGQGMLSELEGSANNFTITNATLNPNGNQSEFAPSNTTKAHANQFMTDPAAAGSLSALTSAGVSLTGGSGGTIYWNPSGSSLPTTSGVQTNATMDLGHEMFHGLDANRGLLDQRRDFGGVKRDEWQAVYRENMVRSQSGLPLRTHYQILKDPSGNLLGGTGPRMITPATTPLLPSWYKP